ncbi:MAG TPA: ribose-phosphate pyrophosphokinase [Bacteroidia bacterium]|jgi:ribose-phosphate pyrophosphokinase|nr:ribose-phosphate pyrophosphokinase [Bacteroidia bacterium]
MKTIVFAFPGNESLAHVLCTGIAAEQGTAIFRRFPDKESYVQIRNDVAQKHVVIVCSLQEPNDKFLSLFFFCKLAKDLKATTISLVAPYLAYMRQDKQFNTGEAVTSNYFASLLSSFVDRLITIDPHLHRINSLEDIYSIPCEIIHASLLISKWIKKNVANALIIGPDSESEQWVSMVAKEAGAPYVVLQKIRKGDKNVEIAFPNLERFKHFTPVLVDDIISTAHTMIETIQHLIDLKMNPPICIGVHAVFAGSAFKELSSSGAQSIITCNTIAHESNGIDISETIIKSLNAFNYESNRI